MKKLFAAAPAKAVGMEILLVDDHELIRDALRSLLRELVEGAIVLEAADFRQATGLIEQHPDLYLILLDVDRDAIDPTRTPTVHGNNRHYVGFVRAVGTLEEERIRCPSSEQGCVRLVDSWSAPFRGSA